MPINFLHPGLFAFGLVCVSIPIFLHLLKRKRRPIPWAAMRFLEQAYKKRRKRMTIEQLILLTIRCLMFIALAIGFGSLVLGDPQRSSLPETMIIVIDDSIGSAHIENDQTRLERNKAFALNALSTLDGDKGDRAALMSSTQPARRLVYPPTNNLSVIKEKILQLESNDAQEDFVGAIELINQDEISPEYEHTQSLVLAGSRSETRSSDTNQLRIQFDSIALLDQSELAQSTQYNIGIMNAQPTRSMVLKGSTNLPTGIRVQLVRTGSSLKEHTTRIDVQNQDSEQVGVHEHTWEIGQTESEFTIAINTSRIESADDGETALLRVLLDQSAHTEDSNVRDNHRFVTIPTRSKIRIALIEQSIRSSDGPTGFTPSRWVRAALAPAQGSEITIQDVVASRCASSLESNTDAIFILSPNAIDDEGWERISQLANNDTLIIIIPDAHNDSLAWIERFSDLFPDLISTGSTLRSFDQPIGIGSTSPSTSSSLLGGLRSELNELAGPITISRSISWEHTQSVTSVLNLSDGSPFVLSSIKNSDANVILFSSSFNLGWTDMMTRPLFVPMLHELVRQGIGSSVHTPSLIAGSTLLREPWVQSHRMLDFSNSINQSQPSSQRDLTLRSNPIGLVDTLGSVRKVIAINPDVHASKLHEFDRALITESVMDHLPIDEQSVRWMDESFERSKNTTSTELSSPDHSIGRYKLNQTALWFIGIAGILALLELILAKLFSLSLDDSSNRPTPSSQRGVSS